MLKWLYTFDLEFRICRTIKRDANLAGLRKIECSSNKTKSKERHSSTSRARRIVLFDLGCRKSRRMSELMTYVGSDDVHRKSRHLVSRVSVRGTLTDAYNEITRTKVEALNSTLWSYTYDRRRPQPRRRKRRRANHSGVEC